MSLLKLGHGLRSIKGKRGGNIYKRDTSGYHSQTYPRLVRYAPKSRQLSQRGFFCECVTAWTDLTGTEFPTLWQIYSSMHPISNKIGKQIILPGRIMFFKINLYRLARGQEILTNPPF